MIKRCTCTHEYQDQLYGKQMRLHTVRGKSKDVFVCTVCGPSQTTRKMRAIAMNYKPEQMEGKR